MAHHWKRPEIQTRILCRTESVPGKFRTICPRFENFGTFGRMASALGSTAKQLQLVFRMGLEPGPPDFKLIRRPNHSATLKQFFYLQEHKD